MSTNGCNNIYYSPGAYYSPGRTEGGRPIMYKGDNVIFGRVSRQDAQRFMSNESESSGLTTWDKVMMIGMPLLSASFTVLGAIFGNKEK
ncbi:hypothetical protein J6S88_01460 [bacterium]|nr:hypothetical protein [bacterium]